MKKRSISFINYNLFSPVKRVRTDDKKSYCYLTKVIFFLKNYFFLKKRTFFRIVYNVCDYLFHLLGISPFVAQFLVFGFVLAVL